ncbi:MAG: hypothetical protein ACE37J_21180 [Pikeienuella sp.]|uniref:hypothetical protein n=1 Tax=Pikeienuella sp. TaxID=2831957 RepID=UPI0039187FD6
MTPEAAGRLVALAAQAKLRDLAAFAALRRRDAALIAASVELETAAREEAAAAAEGGLAAQVALDAFRAAVRLRQVEIAARRQALGPELLAAERVAAGAAGREQAAERLLKEARATRRAAEARKEERERPLPRGRRAASGSAP